MSIATPYTCLLSLSFWICSPWVSPCCVVGWRFWFFTKCLLRNTLVFIIALLKKRFDFDLNWIWRVWEEFGQFPVAVVQSSHWVSSSFTHTEWIIITLNYMTHFKLKFTPSYVANAWHILICIDFETHFQSNHTFISCHKFWRISNPPFMALLKRSQEGFALGKQRLIVNLEGEESHHPLCQFWPCARNVHLEEDTNYILQIPQEPCTKLSVQAQNFHSAQRTQLRATIFTCRSVTGRPC